MSLVIERSQSRLLGEDDRWLYGLETAFPAEHRRRHISPDDLIEKLQFEKLPFRIQSSVDNSSWYDIDNGRHMIEIPRNKRLNTRRTEAPIYIADFDDTLMDTTSWHHQEFS